MNRTEIMELIPHRPPMLLVDELELCGDTAIGRYTVRGDEFFLQGHFPDNPVVPGVILCEIMGQSACVLVADQCRGATPYFTHLTNVKFKNKVLPGDTVVCQSRLVKQKGSFYFIHSQATVNDRVCVSGELAFALVKEG